MKRQEKGEGIMAKNQLLASYFSVVKAVNEARNSSKPLNVIKLFQKASEKQLNAFQNEEKRKEVHRCWNLLEYILGNDDIADDKLTALPGLFRSAYHNMSLETSGQQPSEEGTKFRKQIIYGARSWLESEYRTFVVKHVRNQRFQIGGNALD